MAKVELFEWASIHYRIHKACHGHWVSMGRPKEQEPPSLLPLVRYVQLNDEEKLRRFLTLLEWAAAHEVSILE
jgi:hypothetical protein